MGYNATLVIANDALNDIAQDPLFGQKVADAAMAMAHNPGQRVDIPSGSWANAAHLVEQHHADHTVLVAVGGNLGTVLTSNFGGNHHNPEVKARLLAKLAESLGFDLVPKQGGDAPHPDEHRHNTPRGR